MGGWVLVRVIVQNARPSGFDWVRAHLGAARQLRSLQRWRVSLGGVISIKGERRFARTVCGTDGARAPVIDMPCTAAAW
jgi:hypothetical protein